MRGQARLLPGDEDLASELSKLGLSEHVVNVLIGEKDTPEGKIRLLWVKKLVKEYNYPANQLDVNVSAGVGRDAGKHDIPVRADIVVYRDAPKTQSFIIVETKAKGKKEGLAQAESYSRNLGGEYHIWSDGQYLYPFRSSRYPNLSEPIADIPRWVGDKPIPQKVPKDERGLPPFKDETELRQVIGMCHDLILEKQGHDPAKAFDEMAKLLFLKLYDEREVPNFYEFAVLVDEKPKDVADRLRDLFSKSVWSSKYKDVFFSKFTKTPEVSLELDDFTIFKVVQLLQGYSLVNTTENIQGADIKGTVYEHMVGNTFRGELAQFFTPREIVEFVVEVVGPTKDEKVFDCACGSGGFLIMTLRKLREKMKIEFPNLGKSDRDGQIKHFAEHNVFGTDINDRMIRVAKMNMIMHGDGHAGILHTNGLLTDPDLPEDVKNQLQNLDIILSNPPFAGLEKDPAILKQFKLGKNEKGEPKSVSKEVLFVEKMIDLLREGGRVGLVLPAGVFNNPSMQRLRDHILENTQITHLIGIPHLAFQITGANNEGDLIFFTKKSNPPKDYQIYVDWANYIGFDTTGRKIRENDLNEILLRMDLRKPENLIKISEMKANGRIDPWFYHPKYRDIEKNLAKSKHPLKPISELVKKTENRFEAKKHLNEVFNYIETNDVDLEQGRIMTSSEITGKTAPNRARYILQEGDFLIPNARDCVRGIAVVPKEYDGWVCSNRFFVVKPNIEVVDPTYLYHMLRQVEVLCLLKRNSTGEINPSVGWDALDKVKIPVPKNLDDQKTIVKRIIEQEEEKQKILLKLSEYDARMSEMARDGVPPMQVSKEGFSKLGYDYIGEL